MFPPLSCSSCVAVAATSVQLVVISKTQAPEMLKNEGEGVFGGLSNMLFLLKYLLLSILMSMVFVICFTV